MKTLVINSKIEATGNQRSLLRYAKMIIRRKKISSPNVQLLQGVIFKPEEINMMSIV